MRICERFRSIQGEGVLIGLPTYFIRTVGCNLRCSWCDTTYAFEGGEEMSLEEIVSSVGDAPLVCVTGGEPMVQPEMPELLAMLAAAGKRVQLETNGSVDLSGVPRRDLVMLSMDVKCPSSGMQDRMLLENLAVLSEQDQVKFIVADDRDFDYALEVLEEHPTRANIVFGPVGGTGKLEWLAERVLSSGLQARVLPQLHKIVWGDRRSVRGAAGSPRCIPRRSRPRRRTPLCRRTPGS
jgi:7-carboxy-7-deazaguanine synthase